MKQTIKCLIAVFAAMFLGVAAFAQVTTSSLNGYVADETGDPLVGAAIVAVHTPSGTQYATIANESGRFNINGMRAGGPYKIEVSFLGMATIEYNEVYLKLGEPYELNASMKSSNELDAVVLTADASFNANKTGAGANFSLSAVENMPTIDRSIYDVVKFTPQASVSKNGGISFAGSNNRYNSFQVDGAVANDSFGLAASGTNGGQTGANPISLDAIEEIQVVVAPFDVRQSGFTGGAINAVTKSGTNTVKGSFYTYFNNQDFIGTTAGPIEEGQMREKYDQQLSETYGFTVGAPIIKNKLFIFASAEYYRKSYPNVYNPYDGTYDNIELKNEVFLPDGTSLGKYFNAKMAQAMLDHYKTTYGMEDITDSFTPHQVEDRSINAMARIDWNINDNNKLMFRYQHMDAFADKFSAGSYSYTYNNSSYKQSNKTNTFVVELNSRINDEISNEFRATAVYVRDQRTPGYIGAGMYIQDNVTVNMGTEYSSGANSMASDTYTIADNLTIFKGNHNITVGTHNEIYKFNNVFIQYRCGQYNYSSIADFFTNQNFKYDYKFSDPNITGGTTWAATTYAAQFGLYAQDEWKPTANFTLTYGLRMDMPLLLNKPGELAMSKGIESEYNKTDIAKNSGEMVGVVPKASVLFSPRVGFRWFANDSKTTLLRGGVGLFTGRVPFVWLSNAYNNTGMEMKSVTVKKGEANHIPLTSNPYKEVVEAGLVSASGAGATINTLNRNFKYPQVLRANLAIEQTFGDGWKFTVDGLFSKTLNNVFFRNLAIKKENVVYGVNADAAKSNPAAVAPYYTAITKDYSAIVALENTNRGYTYSVSGQLEKHFDFGLDLMASYTYGHSYSVNDGTSSVAYSNWKYNYSLDTNTDELSFSAFDRPHKVMAVASYTTPKYLNGLQTTIALSYEGQSGGRYSYTMKETEDFNGDGQSGNSVLYVPTQAEIGMMSWKNPADAAKFEQFIREDAYLRNHRGNWAQRNAGIGKFENHFDLHIAQDFYYDKQNGRKLQFIVDFMNISNLFNRNWGLYYGSAKNLQILEVTGLTKDEAGNMTPTYAYSPQYLKLSEFYSRWRCQLGFRLTF